MNYAICLKNLISLTQRKLTKMCERLFVFYLSTLDVEHLDYWLHDEKTLDKILSKFWFEVKTCEGKPYRVSTLKHMRYGINRNLKRRGHEYGIVKSTQFKKSQEKFLKACDLLKAKGYGYVEHYKEIKPKGKLLHNFFFFFY